MTVWCRLSWRARFLNIGLLPISEDRATLGSDSSAVWGFAGGDAFGCRSFLMPGFSHVSVVFQPWEQGWPHYILCLIMGLTSEYVGTLGHDTPAISGQFRSAATIWLQTKQKILGCIKPRILGGSYIIYCCIWTVSTSFQMCC